MEEFLGSRAMSNMNTVILVLLEESVEESVVLDFYG
jgi:hypothetical protein